MAAVDVSALSSMEKDELLCTYAALILHDEGIEISADDINKLITAAGAKVEPYMPGLFAGSLKNVNISDVLSSAGTAGPAPAAGGAAPAAGGSAAAAAEAEPEPEEEEEEEDDMGFSLFD